jgi:hypothetical protein
VKGSAAVSDWREKIKQITDGIGPIGDAVYREIVESVEEAISDAREEGRVMAQYE